MRVSLILGMAMWLGLQCQVLAADEADTVPVLTAGDTQVTAQEIAQILAGMPTEEIQTMLADPAKAGELVQNLIRLHEVERQAQAEALEEDPAIAWELRQARQAILQRALLKHFIVQQNLPDFEQLALEHYQVKSQRYRSPRRIKIAQIFVEIQDGDKDAARQEAEQLLARVQAGESFAELAKQYSDGPNAERGGAFPDWLTARVVPSNPLVGAAFELTEAGQVTEVLESRGGFHILRLLDSEEARQKPFEEVKGKIIEGLVVDYEKQLEQDFLTTLNPAEAVKVNASVLQRLLQEAVGVTTAETPSE